MAKRHLALRRKQKNPGGAWLTVAVVLLAVLACVTISPPRLEDVAAVFAHETPTPTATVSMDAVTLPAREWYIVDADGQAVAACANLLEAEIVRERCGPLASVRRLTTDEVSLRVTASPAQLSALRSSADALGDCFDTLGRMANISALEAQRAAIDKMASLDTLCTSLDAALHGTDNPVVRGLAGLVGSCREAMESLTVDADAELVRKKHATLVLQYDAYVAFLAEQQKGAAPSPSPESDDA